MRLRPMSLACGLFLAAPAAAAALPSCAGGVEIARARVVRVEQNGVMVLSDGRALTLEGIRLPLGEADHAPARFAAQARATLLALAQAAPVTGTANPPKEDRYDRVRVQAFAAQWLQQALLEQGLARVAPSPDRGECTADFYRFEAAARAAGRGLWASPAYRIRTDKDDWRPDAGSFQLIEGVVAGVTTRDGVTTLDFGRNGLLASVGGEDRRAFHSVRLDSLAGRRVRLRGVVQSSNVQSSNGRPLIALGSPAQIEVLN